MTEAIVQMFCYEICTKINLKSEDLTEYTIHTPFMLPDSGYLTIIIKQQQDKQWYITDQKGRLQVHTENNNCNKALYSFIRKLMEDIDIHYLDLKHCRIEKAVLQKIE